MGFLAEAVSDGGVPMFPPDATVGRPLDFAARNRKFRKRLFARDGALGALRDLGLAHALEPAEVHQVLPGRQAPLDVARAFQHGAELRHRG
ncbi:hypothetical protein [Nonomuraea jabiensis]|uniref:Uncharacterized protein n=1 Tax=Nonomuraea jabiensis TaxID=882448 RepID=A0A7W9L8G9_9ACTN|nr:hypothetical protein [Nonomuraea jabiensis]MBB5774460.1 hypothetical protein [Nonomuraea jabiensis]